MRHNRPQRLALAIALALATAAAPTAVAAASSATPANAASMVAHADPMRVGRNGATDLASARAWYEAAHRAGSTTATLRLADMLAAGQGGPREPKRALALLEPLSENGDAGAQLRIGRILVQRHAGVVYNEFVASRNLDRAEAAGLVEASYWKTKLWASSRSPHIHRRIIEWRLAAANGGFVLAQREMADIALDRGRPDVAAGWLRLAARQSDHHSQARLDALIDEGRVQPATVGERDAMLARAAHRGREDAMWALAISGSEDERQHWRAELAARGDATARALIHAPANTTDETSGEGDWHEVAVHVIDEPHAVAITALRPASPRPIDLAITPAAASSGRGPIADLVFDVPTPPPLEIAPAIAITWSVVTPMAHGLPLAVPERHDVVITRVPLPRIVEPSADWRELQADHTLPTRERYEAVAAAALQGDVEAMRALVAIHDRGELEQPVDAELASRWAEQWSRHGDADAWTVWAARLAEGKGTPADMPQALVLWRRAAAAGDADAARYLGYAVWRGHDPREADPRPYFRQAAEAGDADAMNALGVVLETADPDGPGGAAATVWYERAVAAGSSQARYNLALRYLADGVNLTEAARHLRELAYAGDVAAASAYAVLLGTGQGIEIDLDAAARWYRFAAERGRSEAMFNLGLAYAHGHGVPRDVAEAYTWFARARNRGDSDAAAQQLLLAIELSPDVRASAERMAQALPTPTSPRPSDPMGGPARFADTQAPSNNAPHDTP